MNNPLHHVKMTARLAATSAVLFAAATAVAHVVTYPAPPGEALSQDYALEVNGKRVDIYLAKLTDVQDPPSWGLKPGQLGGPYSFASFDFSGNVTVKITSFKKPLDKLVIRPGSSGITPVIEGNTVTFTLDAPRKLSIEPDGVREPLLVFANPLEVDAPKEGDPGVIYYGPGIHKPVNIKVSSGQTLYLAGGAIVKAGVSVSGRDVKIRGRGILCGNDWPWKEGPGRFLGMRDAANVSVEGIILRGAWSWAMPITRCDSVTITNVKICGGKNPNDDGINPCNSRRVVIRDCFIRTDDDCIAMKGTRFGAANDNVQHITVEDCLLWSDRARIFLLGHESQAPYMRNIVLRNLDILHFSMTPFLFEPGEEMSIEDVMVDNVRLNAAKEGGPKQKYSNLITLRPVINKYMRNMVPGKIKNVTFRNITLTGTEEPEGSMVWVKGADANHMVTDVTFENVTWFGQSLAKDSPQVRIEGDTSNIRFVTSGVDTPPLHDRSRARD